MLTRVSVPLEESDGKRLDRLALRRLARVGDGIRLHRDRRSSTARGTRVAERLAGAGEQPLGAHAPLQRGDAHRSSDRVDRALACQLELHEQALESGERRFGAGIGQEDGELGASRPADEIVGTGRAA